MNQEQYINEINSDILKGYGIHDAFSKTCGDFTIEDIFTPDIVYETAKKCASGFYNKADTQRFMADAYYNSYLLCERVLSGKFKPEYYKEHEITERGKKRVIKPPTFKCKVVQKVLCDYLIRPLLEPKMVKTNYASITGRGTDKMYADIETALNYAVRQGKKFSIVTADFSNYFASINISLLMEMLGRYIKDERILNLINSFSPDEYGLSLGNELSQIPASFFPSPIDHYMKDRLGIDYFRYMDDSLAIIEKVKEKEYMLTYQQLAETLGLVCPDNKFTFIRMRRSFSFCKERFVWNEQDQKYNRMINPKIISSERRKLKAFEKKVQAGEMTAEDAFLQYKGVRGFIAHHPRTDAYLRELDTLADRIKRIT